MTLRHIAAAFAFALLAGTGAQAATITQTFDASYSGSRAGEVSFSLTGLASNITGALKIAFTVIGDLGNSDENFLLSLDGSGFGTGCDQNIANDSFGIASDTCSDAANSFRDGILMVDMVTAAVLLADGKLDISFKGSARVDNFVAINNGGELRSGVFFGASATIAIGAGGTVSYETGNPSPVPLPAGLPLLLGGVAGFGLLRRLRKPV